ncbi:MAG: transcriptional repressor [Gammaproteobacteria bacterium]|nr:transcriptional repressor [Gammaproteobacteria bacterium]
MDTQGTVRLAQRSRVVELLERQGVTATQQRVEVGQVLFACPQHLSADQILERVLAMGARVSKATVYNTLNLFSECGLVRTLSIDGDRQFYDPTTTPHHHFYNVDTGELIDIPADALALAALPPAPEGTAHERIDVIIRVRSR